MTLPLNPLFDPAVAQPWIYRLLLILNCFFCFVFESVDMNTRSDRFQNSRGVLLKENILRYTK